MGCAGSAEQHEHPAVGADAYKPIRPSSGTKYHVDALSLKSCKNEDLTAGCPDRRPSGAAAWATPMCEDDDEASHSSSNLYRLLDECCDASTDGRETTEASPLRRSLRMKWEVVKASAFEGVDADPNQYAVPDTRPKGRAHRALMRRIQRWLKYVGEDDVGHLEESYMSAGSGRTSFLSLSNTVSGTDPYSAAGATAGCHRPLFSPRSEHLDRDDVS